MADRTRNDDLNGCRGFVLAFFVGICVLVAGTTWWWLS